MIGKTNWKKHLHQTRKREIDLVFSLLPHAHFASGLEIGAGEGYQTTLLAPHIGKLISSDLNFERMKESLKVKDVIYKKVDADKIEGVFEVGTFDLIFSASVLEHLGDPSKFLCATLPILTDNGYAVHVVPSRHLKVFYLVFYYPHMILFTLDRILGKLKGKPFFRGAQINFENNLNIEDRPRHEGWGKLKKFLFPSVHGNFPSHTKEFIAYGRSRWERKFRKAGYSIVTYTKGPAFSGYGFGYERIRKLAEYFGVSSEHIFIIKRPLLP